MLAIFKFLAPLFSSSIQFLYNSLLLQLIIVVCCASRMITSDNRHGTTSQFLSLVEEKNPSEQYERRSEIGHSLERCTVCLSLYEEGDEIRRLSCEHIFHKACLDRWLQQDLATCPLCRSIVFPDRAVADILVRRWINQRYDGDDDNHDEELENLLYACFAW